MRTAVFVLMLLFLSGLGSVEAKILFVDDFEQDKIGEEPSRWNTSTLTRATQKFLLKRILPILRIKHPKPPVSDSICR